MSAYSITTRGLPQGTLTPMGALLFAASEPGAWYDPSDISTLFQDSAGTTPVTAVEQPVGRMLDKSGRGNHATQATTTKRPVYSRRVNLLTKTEQFDDAVWVKDAGFVTPAAYTSPTGLVFQKYTPDTTTVNNHRVRQSIVLPAGVSHTLSFYVKAAGYTGIKLRATTAWVNFNLTTGTVGNSLNVSSPTITALEDGIYRVSATFSVGASIVYIYVDPSDAISADSAAFAGDGTSGIYISAASVTLSTDAHLPYQWVNTDTDYDADPAKFPAYLRFDGVDDVMQTGNINFTSTDKMTVWAGAVITSHTGSQLIAELGTVSVDAGAFSVFCRTGDARPMWSIASPQYVLFADPASSLTTTINSVVFDRTKNTVGQLSSARQNGVPVIPYTGSSAGAVNSGFANAALNIGARNGGTIHFFNGRIYSLIVRGTQTPLSQIEATELYIKQKMRMP